MRDKICTPGDAVILDCTHNLVKCELGEAGIYVPSVYSTRHPDMCAPGVNWLARASCTYECLHHLNCVIPPCLPLLFYLYVHSCLPLHASLVMIQ